MIRHTAGLFCAAAFFFCLSAIFLHSNPSLAADLLHLFEKIENKQIFSGDLHTHATPLTNNNSQKSDGYTFTLSETYCDTQNFYVSVQITSEEGFPESQRAQVDPDGISSLCLMGNGPIPAFLEILTHKEFPSLEHFLMITHLSVHFIRYLEKTLQKIRIAQNGKFLEFNTVPRKLKTEICISIFRTA